MLVSQCEKKSGQSDRFHLPIPTDQRVGAAIVFEVRLPGGFEFGDDALGEDFAEFDAPLVEGVDVPEDALGEDAHFVEGDEAAEDGGGEFFGEDDIGRAVAVEDAVWGECGGGAFGFDFGEGFSESEGLGLREDIRHEDVVMAAEWVERLGKCDEVAGDEAGALVDELVEAVLAVGAGFAPVDRTRVGIHMVAIEFHMLAVALHGELLEVGGEAFQVLVVGQDGDGLRAVEVVIPQGQEAVEDGDVLLKGRGAEVLVHRMESGEHFAEVVRAEGDHVGEADGGIHRIAAPYPIPEAEHVGGVDAKLGDLLGVCGNGDEVLGDGGFVTTETGERPLAGRGGIGHGLQRGKSLGGNDEERFGRVKVVGGLGEVGAVHIGDESEGERAVGVVAQGFVGHHGPEIRAADADVDDVFNALAGVACPLARADAIGKFGHAVEHGMDFWNDINAIYFDRCRARSAEGCMQNGSVLGDVDLVTTEHGINLFAQTSGIREIDQASDCLAGDQVFRIIQEKPGGFELELLSAFGIGGKEFAEVRKGFGLDGEGFPGGV